MQITSAQYYNNLSGNTAGIKTIINDVLMFVPLDPANTEYAEIMRQVDEGELTIEPADTE